MSQTALAPGFTRSKARPRQVTGLPSSSPFFVLPSVGVRYARPVSQPLCCAAVALAGALVLGGASGCLIYGEDLLVEGTAAGGDGGTGGAGGAGGSGGCVGVCTHLLISEVVVSPTRAELIEVYNPLDTTESLADVWLADFATYYTVTSGSPTVGTTDFLVQFPPGSTIGPGARIVVAIDTVMSFTSEYGVEPDFDLQSMPGTATPGMSGLANANEMVVLFRWDGASALVGDLDYVVWGDASDAMDKSGVTVGGMSYADETPAAEQSVLAAPAALALHRCDSDEPGERSEGGNGVLGHDETSERLTSSFRQGMASPKTSPPAGVCP